MHSLNYEPLYVLEDIEYVSTCIDYNAEHMILMISLFGDLLQYV